MFTTRWKSGKDHCIPDALSRAPVSDPSPEDQEAEEDVEHHVNAITTNASRLALDASLGCFTGDIIWHRKTIDKISKLISAIVDNTIESIC